MSDTTTADQTLPPSLQPGYQPLLPASLQPQPRSPLYQLAGAPAAPSDQSPTPEQRNYTVTGTGPGTWWSRQQQPPGQWQDRPDVQQQPQPPAPQPQPPSSVALNRPPAFQQGHQPGPWPAAYPNSPRFDPAQAPPLPGETPQETADLNKFMGHETGNRGNIINDWAARDPSRYYQGQTCQGYWQITNSTWRDGAQRAGVDLRQYPTAMTAPYQVQRAVALALYRSYGGRPWAVPPGAGERGDRFALRPQQPPPAEPRDYRSWGQDVRDDATLTSAPPRDFGPGPSGQQGLGQPPQESGWVRVLNGVGPLLVGIASLALRMPLSTAITAAGAMARAQDNGQREAYERARTRMQDQLKEANAQQTLESREASDAFVEYGNNNPAGLQQTLAQIALRYNDPIMYRMAERGDLNGIHQLQQRRDLYNQDLTRANKAAQDQKDRQEQDAAVAAMDRKWRQEHPNATEDEAAIAHNEHIGEVQRQFAGTGSGAGVEAPVYDVVDPQGKPTGRQVQRDKNGHLLDMNGQPTSLGPDERLKPVSSREEAGEQEGPVLNVIGADGKPTGQQVRTGKHGGYYDPNDPGKRVELGPGETVQQVPRQGAAGAGGGEGLALYDVVGADGRPTGRQVRMGKQGGLFDLNSPPQPVTLGEGETVRPVSRQAQPQPAATVPETWKGAPYTAPPGVDAGLWQQAVNWAEQGRPPTGLGGRTSSMYQAVEPLVPAAMRALGIPSLADQALKYDAKRHALNSVEQGFGSGVNGRNLISLNTVAEHIALFRQYADALKNGDVQRINQLKNRLATEAGSPEVIDFALAGRITGDEVVRLLTTTGGTLADREDIASRLASYDSPDQFEGAANTLTNYVRGRYLPLRQAYSRGDPERERYFDNNMVTPEARHLFQGPQAPIPGQDDQQQPQQPGQRSGAATPPSWADPQGRPAYLNGRTIWHKPDGKWYFDDQTPVPGQ